MAQRLFYSLHYGVLEKHYLLTAVEKLTRAMLLQESIMSKHLPKSEKRRYHFIFFDLA